MHEAALRRVSVAGLVEEARCAGNWSGPRPHLPSSRIRRRTPPVLPTPKEKGLCVLQQVMWRRGARSASSGVPRTLPEEGARRVQ
jgi:hypothetical protein